MKISYYFLWNINASIQYIFIVYDICTEYWNVTVLETLHIVMLIFFFFYKNGTLSHISLSSNSIFLF